MGNHLRDEVNIALDHTKRWAMRKTIDPEPNTKVIRAYSHIQTIRFFELNQYNLDCLFYTPSRNELAGIAEAANACKTLIYLDMSQLNLNDELFTFFIHRLRPEKISINRLSLRCNDLSDESMIRLCEFISLNKTISSIDLSHNRISDEGFNELGKLITSKDTILDSIDLVENRQTEIGNRELLRGMFFNETITHLTFDTKNRSDIAYRNMFIGKNKCIKSAKERRMVHWKS